MNACPLATPRAGTVAPARAPRLHPVRLLLTNDDGIEAEGLHAMRAALLALPGVELTVIAPDGNRSATGRSITTRRPLVSRQVRFLDGGEGYAIDGSPVDCVRLAWHELAGPRPDMIIAGINHGANLGDDITYSGTVGAALEAIHLGLRVLPSPNWLDRPIWASATRVVTTSTASLHLPRSSSLVARRWGCCRAPCST